MANYSDSDKRETRFYASVLDALSMFAHQSLRAEPNTEYRYSTHGYTLLSAAVEGAARQPFLAYLQEALFRPLGMRSTGPDLRARASAELATFYQLIDGLLLKVEKPEDPSYKWAGGGLTSTPMDLLRLASAYFNGFLEPEIIATMWRSQRLTSGRETGVGLGWRTGLDVGGRTVIEHAGSMEGTRTVLSIFPSQKVVVALMTNREWSSTIEETAHMLALPFLVPPISKSRLRGKSEGTLEVVAVSGQKTTQKAELTLADSSGRLRAGVGDGQESYLLFDLGAGDVYALVRRDGIYYSTLTVADGLVNLRVLGYGSPRFTSPAGHPPFMTFKGQISR
jgi:hypothetical protein